MAFSAELTPDYAAHEPLLFQIADGADSILAALEHTLTAVRALRQERDDAVAAANYNSAVVDDLELEIERITGECARYASRNAALSEELANEKYKNEQAAQVFGKGVFVDVDTLKKRKGPDRPNRPKLSPATAHLIRISHEAGRTVKELAGRYGVNSSTISRIVNGKAY